MMTKRLEMCQIKYGEKVEAVEGRSEKAPLLHFGITSYKACAGVHLRASEAHYTGIDGR